jgi:hypothetical protein
MKVEQAWYCSPSHLGQWGFTGCVRVGRNMVRVPMRELYKPKPDREIIHAFAHVLTLAKVRELDQAQKHIVSKTGKLATELLRFGEVFSSIGRYQGEDREPVEIVGFSRVEITANGWDRYPELDEPDLRIIEQDVQDRVKAHQIDARAARDLQFGKTGNPLAGSKQPEHLLSCLVNCGLCGENFVSEGPRRAARPSPVP